MESPSRADRILIIAPHIDDEPLGAGGYAFDALRAGSFVAVAYLTAGDCNPIPAMIDDRRLIPRPRDFRQEGHDRISEGLQAMQALGVARRNIYIAHRFPEPYFLSEDANLDPPRRFAHLPWRSSRMSRATELRKLSTLRMYRTQRRIDENIAASHSIEEAEMRHERKLDRRQRSRESGQ